MSLSRKAVLRWDAGNPPVTHFRYLSVRRVADFQKLSSLLDKTLQFAGESEDERNPDAQRLTSNSESFREQAAQHPTSATAAVQGLGVAAALVWVLPWA